MDIDEYKDRLDFSLKIELAGVICSAVCLLVRAFVFPQTVSVLLTLIPLAISLGIGLGKSVIVQVEDDEFSERVTEELEEAQEEFAKEHRAISRVVSTGIYLEITAALFMVVTKI